MKNKIFLSPEAKLLQKKVSAPIGNRDYVNYNREFLENYVPNETYYLNEEIRRDLRLRGQLEKTIINKDEEFLLDLAWNSSRLEGNRYSYEEAKEFFKNKSKSDNEDTTMLLNHKEAIVFLQQKTELSPSVVYTLHALLSKKLLGNESASGNIRMIPVKISGSVYLPPAIPFVLEECFLKIIEKTQQINDPFEQSFFLMVHLPYLQTFEDVNKRTSRLAMNIPLLMNNLCPFSFIDVPYEEYVQGLLGIYELNDVTLLREVFVWGYRFSCQRYGIGINVSIIHPLYLKHQEVIKEMVQTIVKKQMSAEDANAYIDAHAPEEKESFEELIHEELEGLHLYSLVSYGLTPNEFQSWEESKTDSGF